MATIRKKGNDSYEIKVSCGYGVDSKQRSQNSGLRSMLNLISVIPLMKECYSSANRVYPAIGYLKLDKINGRHIQQFINDLLENGKSGRTGKPLSRKTLVHHLSFISNVFTYAVKMDMLTDNPCRRVTVPKGEAKEKEIYTLFQP